MTPLLIAAAVRHMEVFSFLVQRGADLSVTDEESNTALMIAARTGLVPAVELLLAKSTPVNVANRWGTTALMQAARVFNIRIVKALLDAGADPDIRDVLGKRAIMYAQEKGKPPIYLIRLLKGEQETGVKVRAHPTVARPPVTRPWWRFWEK
jgi:ankyrin repeat protein